MELAPSKQDLQNMLDGALQLPEAAREMILGQIRDIIKEFKLKLGISGNAIVEVGDSTEACLARFITVDDKMKALKDDVRKLAVINEDEHQLFSVLILGESGTGKELIARALHGDRDSKFLGINCAGLPETLIESELFGYEPNAFTGASPKGKIGLMKAVGKGGTLFLDEIGELPLSVQAKLLRAIQSKRIRKVGAEKEEEIDCRLVCATHHDLHDWAHAEPEKFRLDLYARISTFELRITPLSERPSDILPIIASLQGGGEFVAAISEKNPKLSIEGLLDLSLNVRSLQQHVKRFKVFGRLT